MMDTPEKLLYQATSQVSDEEQSEQKATTLWLANPLMKNKIIILFPMRFPNHYISLPDEDILHELPEESPFSPL